MKTAAVADTKTRLAITLLFSVLIFVVGGCATSQWPRDPVILHADYDKYQGKGYSANDSDPRIVSDKAGRWIVVWTGNSAAQQTGGANCPTGSVKDNKIYSINSTDNGKTWSLPKCLTMGDHNTSPSLATDGKGNYMVVWQAEGTMPTTDTDIFTAMSSNKTWSYPAPSSPWGSGKALNTNASTDQGYDFDPEVVWNGKNKWVVVWASNESLDTPGIGTDLDILVSSSADGKIWTAPKALNTNSANDKGHDSNPSIASDGKGKLVAVWASTDELGAKKLGSDYDILYATSANGVKWSNPEPLNTNASSDKGDDILPSISFGNGKWNVAWTSNDDQKNTLGADQDILVSHSIGTGTGWQPPKPIVSYMTSDKGDDARPFIASGNGKVFCVWQTESDVGAQPSNVGADSDIVMAQSYDDGVTWYFNNVIHTSALGDNAADGSPNHATDGKGNWIAVWTSEFPGPKGQSWGLDYDILAVSFADN